MKQYNAVGIVGFGRFGRLLAEALCPDFTTIIYDPLMAGSIEQRMTFVPSLEELCRHVQTIFLCVPIIMLESCVYELSRVIYPGSVVLDVCSVKMYPEHIMKTILPDTVYNIPTHPMFGPDSAKNGWADLPFVFCPPAEIPNPVGDYWEIWTFWTEYFAKHKSARIVTMSAEEHDRITAYNLCLTQLLGRVLGNIHIQSSAIDAKSFQHLLQMKEISYNDSMELLLGLHRFNPFAAEMRRHLRDELLRVEDLIGNTIYDSKLL